MKKLLVSSVAALALTSSALIAEESGAFVGVGIGYGSTTMKESFSGAGGHDENLSKAGLNYGLIAGYKQFFTESFGLRYYANIDFNNSKLKQTDPDLGSTTLNNINYGVNVDALYNFVTSADMDFGVFLGIGLGANSWSGKTIDILKEGLDGTGKKVSTTGFDAALNVGLRGVFAKAHGIELAARVPFVKTTLYDIDIEGANMKATAHRTYNVGLRYTFGF
ncbi:outer membrane protein [Helicobacter jaachi]|uniref:Outer membrane protein n=1 Tax=Helicobacter jaachi TaxID=1677920 RepID=A0A4U8T6S6_9HELI|nr:outer membrane protein [Helicobacter jaachi]TLD95198.1 outer membrane protein [Helicobacter jaachi]